MESEKHDDLASPDGGSALAQINVDWVLLVTGLVAALFLTSFWFLVIASPFVAVAIIYYVVIDYDFLAVVSILVLVAVVVVCLFLRWTAGGILHGRRLPAVVACIGMLIYAGAVSALMAETVHRDLMTWRETSGVLVPAILMPALIVLLLASFCKREYWRKKL